MKDSTAQIKIRISKKLHKEIIKLATEKRPARTLSDVVTSLCEEALRPSPLIERDEIAARIGSLEQKVRGMRFDVETLGELVALFVFNWCCHTPSISESGRKVALTEGGLRFKAFIETLQKRLNKGELTLATTQRSAGLESDKSKGES